MRSELIIAVGLLNVACQQQAQKPNESRTTDLKRLKEQGILLNPEAFLRPEEKAAEQLNAGHSARLPCTYEKTELGTRVIASLPTDQCYKMTKPERVRGYWSDQFEGSQFCDAPTRACFNSEKNSTWLEFVDPKMERREPTGALYAVELIGRRPLHSGTFGHFGMFQNDIVVDRMISMKRLGPPPPHPTKAEILDEMRKCAADKTCIPNWGDGNAVDE